MIDTEKEFDSCIRVVSVFQLGFNENRNPDFSITFDVILKLDPNANFRYIF